MDLHRSSLTLPSVEGTTMLSLTQDDYLDSDEFVGSTELSAQVQLQTPSVPLLSALEFTSDINDHFPRGDYVAQSQDLFSMFTDLQPSQLLLQSPAGVDAPGHLDANLLLPSATTVQSYADMGSSIDTQVYQGLYSVQENGGNSCSPFAFDLGNIEAGYSCFRLNPQSWRTNEVTTQIPIAPKTGVDTHGMPPSAAKGPSSSLLLPKRKRKRFDAKGRAKAKKIRKLGACFRCKIYKLQCSEELPCVNCLKVKDSQKWPFRANATNLLILVIDCQEFQPSKEGLVEEYVVGGLVRKFLNACQSLLEDEIRDTLSDPILLLTWNEVKRYRATYGTPLIARVLQIYAGAMMNSRYPTPIDANVFGVENETSTPYFFEKLPLPPQLTYQIQTMIGHTVP
ncbi:hypothetical protein Hte_005148 [Hypoxylon texense]